MHADGEWRTHESVILPNAVHRKLREESSSDEEYRAKVKEAEESMVRIGGASKMTVKYRLISPELREKERREKENDNVER